MARNDTKKASAYEYNKGLAAYNNSTNVFKWALVTNTYASIDADATSLNLADFTVVASAGLYVANQTIASTTWAQTGDTSAIDGTDLSFAADGSNPTTGTCYIVYNDTSAADDVVCITDITTDGTTPVDTQLGFSVAFNAGGIASVQVNV